MGSGVELRSIELEVVAPDLFRPIHCSIGIGHEAFRGFSIFWVICDTEACCRPYAMVAQLKRLRYCCAEFLQRFCDEVDVLRLIRKHKDELVTAESNNSIGRTDAPHHPFGGRFEQPVACVMAECVIDELKIVQIDEDDRNPAIISFGV